MAQTDYDKYVIAAIDTHERAYQAKRDLEDIGIRNSEIRMYHNDGGPETIDRFYGHLEEIYAAVSDASWMSEHKERYRSAFRDGQVILTVHTEDRADEAKSLLERYERDNVPAGKESSAEELQYGREERIQLSEEELRIRKEDVRTGEVRVRKEVDTERQEFEVPVTKEEVYVERRPATGEQRASDEIAPGEEVRIPLHEERVDVEKKAVPREEVVIGKREVTETEHVEGEVRKERLEVEEEEGRTKVPPHVAKETGKRPGPEKRPPL